MSVPDDDPIYLDGEDLACLGMRRADWEPFFPRTDEDWEKLFAALQAAKGKPPKPRKPNIRTLIEQAKAAGATAITLPDGTRLELAGAPDPATESNPWRADLKVMKK
jgi:hypothetical protein